MTGAAGGEWTRNPLWPDFVRFAAAQLETGDWDPVYPVIGELVKGRTMEERVWWVLIYVAHYDIPATYARLEEGAEPEWCGTERRGHRDGRKLRRHLAELDEYREAYGGAAEWLGRMLTGDPGEDWVRVQAELRQPWGNGAWAAWKTAEILQKSLGWPLEPTTLGMDGPFGPRAGVVRLAPELEGAPWREVEERGKRIAADLERALGRRCDLAQAETMFCDFNSVLNGRYYVGHDLDHMAHRIAHEPLLSRPGRERLWKARERVFSPRVLVERGRGGGAAAMYRGERKGAYRDGGGAMPMPWEPWSATAATTHIQGELKL
jgi:hypothetical protein